MQTARQKKDRGKGRTYGGSICVNWKSSVRSPGGERDRSSEMYGEITQPPTWGLKEASGEVPSILVQREHGWRVGVHVLRQMQAKLTAKSSDGYI